MTEQTEQSKMLGALISKAWSDEAFKARLLSSTMGALKENCIDVPDGVTVKAVESTYRLFDPAREFFLFMAESMTCSGGYCSKKELIAPWCATLVGQVAVDKMATGICACSFVPEADFQIDEHSSLGILLICRCFS